MMTAAENADARRAEQARTALLRDLQEMKKMGHDMLEHTESAIHKAPLLLGLGAAGIALVGVAVFASRRPAARFPAWRRERSFLAEAARSAALSALGILSGRITQRLLAAAVPEPAPPV